MRATPSCSPDFLPRALACSSDIRLKNVFRRPLEMVTRPKFSASASYSTCFLSAWFAITFTLILFFCASSSSCSATSVSMRKIRVPSRLNFAPVTILGKNRYGNCNQAHIHVGFIGPRRETARINYRGQTSDPSRKSGFLMKKTTSMREQASEKHSETAAQLLVRCLENEGVKYAFGIPGEENIHFIDALNNSSIRLVHGRHLRPPNRSGGSLRGDPRTRSDQPPTRNRGRQ